MVCTINNGMKFIRLTENEYISLSQNAKDNPLYVFFIYPNS